jgi:hypothetical protein
VGIGVSVAGGRVRTTTACDGIAGVGSGGGLEQATILQRNKLIKSKTQLCFCIIL